MRGKYFRGKDKEIYFFVKIQEFPPNKLAGHAKRGGHKS